MVMLAVEVPSMQHKAEMPLLIVEWKGREKIYASGRRWFVVLGNDTAATSCSEHAMHSGHANAVP